MNTEQKNKAESPKSPRPEGKIAKGENTEEKLATSKSPSRSRLPSSSSSLSLSPSPSPERKAPSDEESQRKSWDPPRSHSTTLPYRRFSHELRRRPSYEDRWEDRRSRPDPRRRRSPSFQHYYRQEGRRSYKGVSPEPSWESKVQAFMQNLGPLPQNSDEAKTLPGQEVNASASGEMKVETVTTLESNPPPPGVESAEEEFEDLKATPLVRYVGKKLTAKKTKLCLEGTFQYSLLSLLTRAEWVAARTLQLLDEAGFKENSFYLTATGSNGTALESELKSATFSGKVNLGGKPELVAQVLRVIEYIVKYYTSKGEEESEEEEEKDVMPGQGIGGLLRHLTGEKGGDSKQEEEVDEPPTPQPPTNPWALVEDHLNAERLRPLSDMKNFIAKDLLRLGDEALASPGLAFQVAQEMISAFVLVGLSHAFLVHLVMQAPSAEDILPPKDVVAGPKRKCVYNEVMDRLVRSRALLPPLTDGQLDYAVRKALTYVMRGCNKMPAPPKVLSTGPNIVFNYLPPGLREMENKVHNGGPASDEVNSMLEAGETPKPSTEVPAEDKESTDPMNSILNPVVDDDAKRDLLPNRHYLFCCIHAEFIQLQGKSQLYELSVYAQDLTSLTVYVTPEPMKSQPELLESLGFVANPDRDEYYFVKVGVGVVKTLTLKKAAQNVTHFLEEKRQASAENANNGIVLNFYEEEELVTVMEALEQAGHKDLFIDTVKGFGCLDSYIKKHRSRQLSYSGPKLSIGTDDSFFHAEVRRGLSSRDLVSKSKAESLFQATEFFLDAPPNYSNYYRDHCFPCFGSRASEIRSQQQRLSEMFHLEVFLAARLREWGGELSLEGVYGTGKRSGRDLRDKHSTVARRVCRMLVEKGLHMKSLRKTFTKSGSSLSSSVLLEGMSEVQRLRVIEQTMRCLHIVKEYFSSPSESSRH